MQVIIKYPNGCMTINLDNFFPSSEGKIRKLLKIINMDWEQGDSIKQQIKVWMMQEIVLCEKQAKEYANKYVDIHPKVRETESRVEMKAEYLKGLISRRETSEFKKLQQELKELKNRLSSLKSLERTYNSSFKYYHTRKERLQRNSVVLA